MTYADSEVIYIHEHCDSDEIALLGVLDRDCTKPTGRTRDNDTAASADYKE